MKMNSTKKKLALSLAVAMVMSSAPVLSLQSFADVQTQKTDYEMAYEAVEALYANPYITGTDQDDIANAQEYINILPDGLAKTNLQNILNVVKVHNAVAYAYANPYLPQNVDKANLALQNFEGAGSEFLQGIMVSVNAVYDANVVLNGIWANINKLSNWDSAEYDLQKAELTNAIAGFEAAGVLPFLVEAFTNVNEETSNMATVLNLIDIARENPTAANIQAAQAALENVTYPAAIENLSKLIAEVDSEAFLKVLSISAIDSTSFKVTFNKEVESVLPANFKVAQKDNSAVFYVKSAVLAEDKLSATVTLYDAMVDGKTYVVETSEIATDSDEFVYNKAIPASIAFESKLPQAGSVDLDDYVVVKDAAGNEIKTGFTVVYTGNVAIGAGNVISTSGLTSVTLNATITLADGTKVTTGNKIVAVEAAKVATVDTFKLVKSNTDVATLFLNGSTLDKDGEAITAGTLTLSATFKDQYDQAISGTPVYESLTPTVVAVNAANGNVTPVSVGTAYVRVTNGDATKTIQVEVKANPKLTAIEVVDTLSVVGLSTAPAGELKVELKDQYGKLITASTVVTVTNSDATVVTAVTPSATTSGKVTIPVQGLKEGTAKITLTVGTVKAEVAVTARKADVVADYEIVATDDNLDLNGSASPANADATIKVFELDANGNRVKEISTDSTISYVLPTTGSLIQPNSSTKNVFENKTSNTTTGATVVTVKAGTLTIGTATINVVNTTDSVASIAVVNPLIKLNTSALVSGFDIDEVAKNIKMTTKSGKVLANDVSGELALKVAAIDEVISSSSAVTVAAKTAVAADTAIEGASQKATLTIKFVDETIAPVAFTVEVADVTAPTVSTKIASSGTGVTGPHTLVFSEAIDADSRAAVKAIVDGAYTANGDATVSSTWGINNKTLTVTITPGTGSVDLVALTVPTGFKVKDLAGNESAVLAVGDLQ